MVITVKVPNSGSAYSAYAMALGTKLLQLSVILKYWISDKKFVINVIIKNFQSISYYP